MADIAYTKFPEYICKFPGVSVPEQHKVSGFSGYMPVTGYSKAGYIPTGGQSTRTDSNQAVQECVPVHITMIESLLELVSAKIAGEGMMNDKEIECVTLVRNKDKKHTEGFKQVLKNVEVARYGDALMITYQVYETEVFNGDEAPIPGGYNFLDQEKTD